VTRYYFDIRGDTQLYPDEEGIEFATQREAEVEAAESLAGLAKGNSDIDERPDASIEVRTDAGPVFRSLAKKHGIKGIPFVVVGGKLDLAKEAGNVVDLMEALRRSVGQESASSKASNRSRSRTRRRPARRRC
jgi:non-homologous end joining protein Ku